MLIVVSMLIYLGPIGPIPTELHYPLRGPDVEIAKLHLTV